jgi:hypothetical protein
MSLESIPGMISDMSSSLTSVLKRYLSEPAASGVDFAESLVGAKSDVTVDISPEYQELINKQIEVQTELQNVTFLSNIERTNHETRMAPVRNIRTS